MSFRSTILRMAYPILRFIGRIGLPKRKITDEFFHRAMRHLKPGDVILVRTDWEASNFLQAGFWKHAALYVGGKDLCDIPMVVEATTKGVKTTGLANLLFSNDYILVLRAKFPVSEVEISKVTQNALSLVGQPYDYQFTPTNKAWYCSEIIWWAYAQAIEENPFTPRETMGVLTVTPEDFARASKKWEVILDSREAQSPLR